MSSDEENEKKITCIYCGYRMSDLCYGKRTLCNHGNFVCVKCSARYYNRVWFNKNMWEEYVNA